MRVTGSRPELPVAAAPVIRPGAELPAGYELELAWLVLVLACLAAIGMFPAWRVIPFDLIWISLALLLGYRLAWQAHRRLVARERAAMAAETDRVLTVQRQFLQDASHQLRTPITIALGHAELLAGALAERQQQRDIHVVVGELERLKGLSERLLLVAASENPDFLLPEQVELDLLVADVLRRWQPTAPRCWQLGQLDQVSALADRERLGHALDALIENAVRHTRPDQSIKVSVSLDHLARAARIVIEDAGAGIAGRDLPHIFDRFRTTSAAGQRGTGLGLALVRAIARGHGGEVYVQSALGQGSRFELLLPAMIDQSGIRPTLGQEAW